MSRQARQPSRDLRSNLNAIDERSRQSGNRKSSPLTPAAHVDVFDDDIKNIDIHSDGSTKEFADEEHRSSLLHKALAAFPAVIVIPPSTVPASTAELKTSITSISSHPFSTDNFCSTSLPSLQNEESKRTTSHHQPPIDQISRTSLTSTWLNIPSTHNNHQHKSSPAVTDDARRDSAVSTSSSSSTSQTSSYLAPAAAGLNLTSIRRSRTAHKISQISEASQHNPVPRFDTAAYAPPLTSYKPSLSRPEGPSRKQALLVPDNFTRSQDAYNTINTTNAAHSTQFVPKKYDAVIIEMEPPPHPFGPRSSLLLGLKDKRDPIRKKSSSAKAEHEASSTYTADKETLSVRIVIESTAKQKLQTFVERLARRATRVRDEIVWEEPPSASSSDEHDSSPSGAESASKAASDGETVEVKAERERRHRAERQDEFRKRLEALAANDMRIPPPADKNAKPFSETVELWGPHTWRPPAWLEKIYPRPFSTQTNYKFLTWLAIVSFAFLYNAFAFPLRTMFDYEKIVPLWFWLTLDLLSDLINFVDLVLVKPLVEVPEHGIFLTKRRDTALHYARSRLFIADVIAVVPIDYILWASHAIMHGKIYAVMRLGRLVKFGTYRTFFDRLDMVSSVPNVLRIVKTMLYMLFLLHCNAGIYYAISKYEHSASNIYNIWTYNGKEIAYVRCFFYAVKTGTDIGNNDPPLSVLERFYMTFCWLSGVFIFATLIEQVHGIVDNMHEREDEYRAKMNETIHYLQKMDIPNVTQERVRQWFAYNWHFQKTLNENDFIEVLPHKLKQDVALTVHYETLAKVELFQDCETELVRDLVLRLTPRLYLPGDFICKKGEVGHEMFIIKYGYAEVCGGPNNSIVFVTLGEGTVFGEIALLAVGGGNRRTADVRSKGISQLFVLKKHDLEAVIVDYPIAQRVLHKKAKMLVRSQKLKEQQEAAAAGVRVIDGGRSAAKLSETASVQQPHQTMADVVLQLLPVASEIRRRLSSFPPPSVPTSRFSAASEPSTKRLRKRTVGSRKSSKVSLDGAAKATQLPSLANETIVNQSSPRSQHVSFDSDFDATDTNPNKHAPDSKNVGSKDVDAGSQTNNETEQKNVLSLHVQSLELKQYSPVVIENAGTDGAKQNPMYPLPPPVKR